MNATIELIFWIIVATIIAVVVIYKKLDKRDMSVGLVLLFIANIYLVHYFGAIANAFPWYRNANLSYTLDGFRLTVFGLLSFTFASLIIGPHLIQLLPLHRLKGYGTKPNIDLKKLHNIGLLYIMIGILCLLIVISRILSIPSVSGLVYSGILLAVAGACLMCLKAIILKRLSELVFWICAALLFPLITIIFGGHIWFGLAWLLIVGVFVIKYVEPKRKLFLLGIVLAYVAMSFFQTYMRDRGDLRNLLKIGADTSQVVANFEQTLLDPEYFSIFDSDHLDTLAGRLNQNELVGEGYDYLRFRGNFAKGETLTNAFYALVPRLFWPEKPIVAGDDWYVFVFTGKFIPDDTSLGLGYVLEFYGNFGLWGVVIGFFVLGILLTVFDYISAYHLSMGNWREFTIWFLPSTALANPENVIATIVSTSVLYLIAAIIASKLPVSLVKPAMYASLGIIILGLFLFLYFPLVSPIFSYVLLLFVLIVAYILYKYKILDRFSLPFLRGYIK